MKKLFAWMPRFWESRVSTVGVAMTTVAGCTLLLAIAADFAAPGMNVYATAFAFLVMPVFFLVGLLLIPIGLVLKRRSDRKRGIEPGPAEDRPFTNLLRNKRARRNLLFLGGATFLNILLIGGGGHKALTFMESPEFCGTMCHSVMEPEYQAYLRSPHSRVACVDCHIGPGASWAVRSKIDGLRQVWHTLRGTYDRPIPAPVHELRPARETCEQCHWPEKFHGNRVVVRTHFQEDEENSEEITALVLRVGGVNALTREYEGIHWHVSADAVVRYEALDEKRERIGKIQVLRGDEVIREYLPEGETGPAKEVRVMDCVDCHNRPTHQYDGSPDQALDFAFRTGLLDAEVPYLKKLARGILAREDRPRDSVETAYEAELAAAYDEQHPDQKPDADALEKAAAGMAELYRRNIFPRLNLGWDTYPTHIGHAGEEADLRGCFRCHDEKHKTADGQALSQDCELCHQMLAQEETLEDLDEELRTLLFGESD